MSVAAANLGSQQALTGHHKTSFSSWLLIAFHASLAREIPARIGSQSVSARFHQLEPGTQLIIAGFSLLFFVE